MAKLRAALDEVASGHGRFGMLAGEPGIGKTRLVLEFAAIAEYSGVGVFCGRRYEGEEAPVNHPAFLQVGGAVTNGSLPVRLRLRDRLGFTATFPA